MVPRIQRLPHTVLYLARPSVEVDVSPPNNWISGPGVALQLLAPSWLLLLAAGGCTRATFEGESEGSETDQTLHCADWEADDPLPPGVEGLVGRYLVRADSFSLQQFSEVLSSPWYASAHMLSLSVGHIKQGETGLLLELEPCQWSTSFDAVGSVLTARLTVGEEGERPSIPLRTLHMRFGPGCSWSAMPEGPTPWGFTDQSTAGCDQPWQQRAQPERPWLTGETCSCSAAATELPQDERDCRVSDPDGDGKPGFTAALRSNELGTNRYFFASLSTTAFVDGLLDPSGRHLAHERFTQTQTLLGCEKVGQGSNVGQLLAPLAFDCEDFPEVMRCDVDTSRVQLLRVDDATPSDRLCDKAELTLGRENVDFPTDACGP